MKLVYNPHQDRLAVAIPIFQKHDLELNTMDVPWQNNYSLGLTMDQPLAYVIATEKDASVIGAEFYFQCLKEERIVEIGDL
jgi:hypothetical protein